MWALFALGAALLASFNPILYKRMLKDTDVVIAVWGVTLLALPLLGLFTLALTPQLPRMDAWFAFGVLGSASLNSAAHLANTRALKLADVSLITPLLTFSPIFTLLISAIFPGETPTARGSLGVGLVLLGAYWLNHTPGAGWLAPFKSLAFTPGVILVLLAGVLWAITPPVLVRGRSAIRKLFLHRREWFFAGLIAGSAPVLGYTAFSLGLIGYVTTLFKLSVLLTVAWGFLFLNERGLAQRLPGAVLMLAGTILMVNW